MGDGVNFSRGQASERGVVIVHSSDLHLGPDSSYGPSSSFEKLSVLREVLTVGTQVRADLVVLAGDTFDNNRQESKLIDKSARALAEYGAPVVILPGNHDPLTPDSVFRRMDLGTISNVCVLGLSVEEAVHFPDLGLEVWGRAHLDYSDMAPLRQPRSRSTRFLRRFANSRWPILFICTGSPITTPYFVTSAHSFANTTPWSR